MFYYICMLPVKWRNNNEIAEKPPATASDIHLHEVVRHPRPMYEQISFCVRNMFVLSTLQMNYVRTLPKDKVLELVEIYNRIMENVNEAL